MQDLTEMELIVSIDALETHRTKRTARKIPAQHASAVAMELATIDHAHEKLTAALEKMRAGETID